MSNVIRLLHRLTGVAGSPGSVQPSGVVAVNFAPSGTPELWASDGSAWKQLNPAGSVPFATGADVLTGTSTTTAVTPKALADSSVATSSGIADAGKFIKLDANGKIDTSVLSVDAMEFKSTVLPSAAAPASPNKGDVYLISADGTMGAGWTGATGTAMRTGDQLIWDGSAWQIVGGAQIDPSAYLPLAGTAGAVGAAMASGAVITMNPAAAGNTVIDAAGGAVTNAVINCGTF